MAAGCWKNLQALAADQIILSRYYYTINLPRRTTRGWLPATSPVSQVSGWLPIQREQEFPIRFLSCPVQ